MKSVRMNMLNRIFMRLLPLKYLRWQKNDVIQVVRVTLLPRLVEVLQPGGQAIIGHILNVVILDQPFKVRFGETAFNAQPLGLEFVQLRKRLTIRVQLEK